MEREELSTYDDAYWRLLDAQLSPYERYARRHGLTEREMYVLEVLWRRPEDCLQSEICERLSATRQTVSAIVKKFWKLGYLSLTGSETDRRNKVVRLTDAGHAWVERLVPPVLEAQAAAMARLERADILELLRLTGLLSRHIQEEFAPLLADRDPGTDRGV